MTFLDDRRRGAEEAFFARQNETLRVQLRSATGEPATQADLSAASGIHGDAVLRTLKDLGVAPEGAAVLSLIPLVAVAWADGDVTSAERDELLSAAAEAGLDRTSAGYQLFAGWLDDHPSDALLQRWKDYASAVIVDMDPAGRDAFRREILDKARAVAAAAGGFLGLGRVSAAEEAVLADIEQTLRA